MDISEAARAMGRARSPAKTEAVRQNARQPRPTARKQVQDVPCTCVVGAAELDASLHRGTCRRWRWNYARKRRAAQAAQKKETTEQMIYIVTDRNDADRTDPIIDTFTTREAAEAFAAQWSADNGGTSCAVEEWTSVEDARGE